MKDIGEKGMKLRLWFLILAFWGAGLNSAESTVLSVREYHLRSVVEFEQQAKKEEQIIEEHRRMKAEYQRADANSKAAPLADPGEKTGGTNRLGQKLPPGKALKDMERHCEEIIRDAEKLKKDCEDAAKWHREQVRIEDKEFGK